MKVNKLKTFVLQSDGTWIHKDVPGPASLEQWKFSWRVFRVAAIMLGIVAEAALQRYQRHIEKLVQLYPDCWGLIYLAEDKFRHEHIDRVRRRIEGDVARGIAAPPLWDKASPWSAAFLEGTSEREAFWDDQVRHPALAWMAAGRHGSPAAFEETAAARAVRDSSPRRPRDGQRSAAGPDRPWGMGTSKKAENRRWKRESDAPAPSGDAAKRQRQELKGKGRGKGKEKSQQERRTRKFVSTQDGKPLCFAWNDGQGKCAEPHGPCANGRAHACTNCRSPNHRACDKKCG